MPRALCFVGAAAFHGRLYVTGGVGGSMNPIKDTYRYDPATNAWTARGGLG